METLSSHEELLEGQWLMVGSRVEADATEQRIKALISSSLTLLGSTPDGWSQLYKDTTDGRLWQLTYPKAETHGGGPSKLENISAQSAREIYGSSV